MKRIKAPNTGEFIKSGFKVIISHRLPKNINLDEVFKAVRNTVPSHLFSGLDCVYVGEFSFLKDRGLNAMYKDAALFVSNKQDSDSDMIDDIIHEIAHLVEDNNKQTIYQDLKISNEFLHKRKQLYHNLESDKQTFNTYYPNYGQFTKIEYDYEFDFFLYKTIGYDNLALLTMNIFYSPYAATSLREYFANGFEAYFYHRDIERLKNISPALYNKIIHLEFKR